MCAWPKKLDHELRCIMEQFTKRVKERIRDEARLDNCKPDLPTTSISTSKRGRIRLNAH